MITQDEKVAFIDGVLDVLEGEIPLALWEHSKYSAAVDVWRLRCTLGVIANWKEFEGDVPIEDKIGRAHV